MKTLLLILGLVNFWLDMKNSDEMNYLKVKYSKHLRETSFSFSARSCYADLRWMYKTTDDLVTPQFIKSEFMSQQKDAHLRGGYLMFLLGIALTTIGVEFVMNKKARAIKQYNRSLVIHYESMQKRNHDLHTKIKLLKRKSEKDCQAMQVLAHDLRSPVAAIVGLSSFMIDEHKLAPEDLEVIDLIHTSGQDSLKVINEILEDELIIATPRERVNLKQLLGYCMAQLKIKADKKELCLRVDGPDISLTIDRAKIWRVMTNLLTNAIKFSPAMSEITVTVSQFDGYARVAIADRGIGIPPHLRNQLFGQNEDRKRRGTAGEKSYGMGLAIAKNYVEAHGGLLTFESRTQGGTTFFVDLPQG